MYYENVDLMEWGRRIKGAVIVIVRGNRNRIELRETKAIH